MDAAGLTALVLLLQTLPLDTRYLLRYERSTLLQGQWWRALTGHFLLLGWAHACLNLAGLWLCCVLAEARVSAPGLVARLLVLGLGVSALLCTLSPSVAHYVGLSGVLYGLLVWLMAPRCFEGTASPRPSPWPWSLGHAAGSCARPRAVDRHQGFPSPV
ncbi:MAG: rhombosortase [Aquabacterium sp.]|uniref:rhombosortase n=1 Tax=Aquabacterium sp. TaxID=1872578 RepID=UPI003BB02E5F